jgi:hypothetical protein
MATIVFLIKDMHQRDDQSKFCAIAEGYISKPKK